MKIKIFLSCTILCFTPVFLHAVHVSDPQTHALINASNAAQSANCALEEATKLIQHLERAANQVTQIGHMIDTFNNLEIQREFFTFIPYFVERMPFLTKTERDRCKCRYPRLCRYADLSRDCYAKSKVI